MKKNSGNIIYTNIKKETFQKPLYTELSIHKYHEARSYSRKKKKKNGSKLGVLWTFWA